MFEEREAMIRHWFHMWLEKEDLGIEQIFAPDCIYVESWGPRYDGTKAIKYWFEEWNRRGEVVAWEIKQFFHKEEQTMVEWHFHDEMADGRSENFDGVSLIEWDCTGKIAFLKEFGCQLPNYNPYEREHAL